MIDVSPEAYYDNLVIVAEAPASILPMSVIELHLYSYLACILALFKGLPIADWGYTYAVTSDGFPFSADLENARRTASAKDFIWSDNAGLMMQGEKLATEISIVESLGTWSARREYISAATQCAVALPVGAIRYAINQSAGLPTSLALGQRRQLLESDDIHLLYEEYAVVKSVLGSSDGLLSPAVIWLSARIMRGEGGDDGVQH